MFLCTCLLCIAYMHICACIICVRVYICVCCICVCMCIAYEHLCVCKCACFCLHVSVDMFGVYSIHAYLCMYDMYMCVRVCECICVYPMCMSVCVCAGTHSRYLEVREHRWCCSQLSLCSRQGPPQPTTVCPRLPNPPALGDSSASTSCLPVGVLGLHMHATMTACPP